MERKGISGGACVWLAGWIYVFIRLGIGRRRKRPAMDAQILGVLCVLGSIPAADMVFYE